MKHILPFIAAVAVAGTLSAQTTYFAEDFNGAFPPTGWSLVNNNASAAQGWIQSADLRAWHEDESFGTSDDSLISPSFDLSTATMAYVHFNGETNWAAYLANNPGSLGDGYTNLEVSTDGGLTWTMVWTDTALNSGDTYTPDVDISSYVGNASVMVQLHYYGTFAHESWIDNILVDDSPTGPPPPGTLWTVNLPAAFASAPFTDDFDVNAGVIPPYMALTNVDALTGLVDVEAWCNVGQLAPCIIPNSGAFNLEMGLDPLSTNYHNVRNSCVIALDGLGTANMNIDFSAYDAGEENNTADGIWISADGLNWFNVSGDWGSLIGATSTWEAFLDMDLTGTPVDTLGQFYVMFQQEDNFPYNYLDGIGIDDITIDGNTGGGGGLVYSIANLVAGQVATFSVTGATAGGTVMLGYSLTGAGPTNTQFGVVDMSLPITVLTSMVANGSGDADYMPNVPGNAAGVTLYTQGVDLTSGTLTNSLAQTVL